MQVRWEGILGIPVAGLEAGATMRAWFAMFLEFCDAKIVRHQGCVNPLRKEEAERRLLRWHEGYSRDRWRSGRFDPTRSSAFGLRHAQVILLDTHVVVWLRRELRKLSRNAEAAIRRAPSSGFVAISAISLVESGILVGSGRLRTIGTVEGTIRQFVEEIKVQPSDS